MQRNNFGLSVPLRQAMEIKLVKEVSLSAGRKSFEEGYRTFLPSSFLDLARVAQTSAQWSTSC